MCVCVMKLFGYVQKLQIAHLIPLKTINIVIYNKFSKPRLGRTGPVFRLSSPIAPDALVLGFRIRVKIKVRVGKH